MITSADYPRAILRGMGVIHPFGDRWQGMHEQLLHAAPKASQDPILATTQPKPPARQAVPLAAPKTPAEKSARRIMSRGAALAAQACASALEDASWDLAPKDIGFYLGVGASGGDPVQLQRILSASMTPDGFSLEAFGDAGLRACNPLYAFQLMNNFTLCHGGILHGPQGENAAFFSRGVGTLTALQEAIYALQEGSCQGVLVGGADTALDPVTSAELCRDGFGAMLAAEGAAILALVPVDTHPNGIHIGACPPQRDIVEAMHPLDAFAPNIVIIAPWGDLLRDRWLCALRQHFQVPIYDFTAAFGESLAATPAMAWAAAGDWLHQSPSAQRLAVISHGVDDGICLVFLEQGRQP